MAKENEKWITVNGTHVLVEKGQSKEEAIDNAFEDKKADHKVNGGRKQTNASADILFDDYGVDKEKHKDLYDKFINGDLGEEEMWAILKNIKDREDFDNDYELEFEEYGKEDNSQVDSKPIDNSAMERLKTAINKGEFNRYDEWDNDNANFKTAINYINQNPELRKDIESYIKDYYQMKIDDWEEEGNQEMVDFVRNDMNQSLAQLDNPNESTISDSDPEATFYNIVSDKLEEHFKNQNRNVNENQQNDNSKPKTNKVKASDLKVGDTVYAAYNANFPEKVKTTVGSIRRQNGLLNITLLDENQNYFKTTQVVSDAYFDKEESNFPKFINNPINDIKNDNNKEIIKKAFNALDANDSLKIIQNEPELYKKYQKISRDNPDTSYWYRLSLLDREE